MDCANEGKHFPPSFTSSLLCREQEKKQDRKDAKQSTNELEGVVHPLRDSMQLRDGICMHKIIIGWPNMFLFVIFQWFWRRSLFWCVPFWCERLTGSGLPPLHLLGAFLCCFPLSYLLMKAPQYWYTLHFSEMLCRVGFLWENWKDLLIPLKGLSKRKADATPVNLISNPHWRYHKAISTISVQILSAHQDPIQMTIYSRKPQLKVGPLSSESLYFHLQLFCGIISVARCL